MKLIIQCALALVVINAGNAIAFPAMLSEEEQPSNAIVSRGCLGGSYAQCYRLSTHVRWGATRPRARWHACRLAIRCSTETADWIAPSEKAAVSALDAAQTPSEQVK